MANFESKTMSTTFKLAEDKNVIALRNLLDHTVTDWGDMNYDFDGYNGTYCIYCFGSICGYVEDLEAYDNGDEEPDYDLFCEKMQELLTDKGCVIIYSIGSEKFRYFNANATVITKHRIDFVTLRKIAEDRAKNLIDEEIQDIIKSKKENK